ncbi:MAG: HEAT repeat domain-containing protein [Spirochaetaceae bacterium]|nr:HEAT repeat domain-containing protein [Spirochaetaceae bacterium]
MGIVKTFSKIGDPSVLGTLLPYFYDPQLKVQNAVKFAFVEFGADSIPYLLNVLYNPVPQTQLAVLGLLEALQQDDSISPIIELFDSKNERVRERAVYTVSTFKDKAVQNLGEALRAESENIVINSIELLSRIDSDDSLTYLIPMLINENGLIAEAAFNAILSFGEKAGDRFLEILDKRDQTLYDSAIKGLVLLRDVRLIVDSNTSLYNRNNRNRLFILRASRADLLDYLNKISVSGLIVRDFTFIKDLNIAAALLIQSEREIGISGSKYTTFYISKKDFEKKAEDAQKLSFSYMRNYMNSKNPEDLETAKKQQEYSDMFKEAAENLDDQLRNYIGTTEEEKSLIHSFESSRNRILELYESVSLNRKNLADDILNIYNLSYKNIRDGQLALFY